MCNCETKNYFQRNLEHVFERTLLRWWKIYGNQISLREKPASVRSTGNYSENRKLKFKLFNLRLTLSSATRLCVYISELFELQSVISHVLRFHIVYFYSRKNYVMKVIFVRKSHIHMLLCFEKSRERFLYERIIKKSNKRWVRWKQRCTLLATSCAFNHDLLSAMMTWM